MYFVNSKPYSYSASVITVLCAIPWYIAPHYKGPWFYLVQYVCLLQCDRIVLISFQIAPFGMKVLPSFESVNYLVCQTITCLFGAAEKVVVVVILFPTEYKQWRREYMSNIITTRKPQILMMLLVVTREDRCSSGWQPRSGWQPKVRQLINVGALYAQYIPWCLHTVCVLLWFCVVT